MTEQEQAVIDAVMAWLDDGGSRQSSLLPGVKDAARALQDSRVTPEVQAEYRRALREYFAARAAFAKAPELPPSVTERLWEEVEKEAKP